MLSSYHFIALSILAIAGYSVSAMLVKQGGLKLITHRRFWNFILLFSFLVSGILGLLIAFLIDYKLSINWYREFLWFHVEGGMIMAIVSLFHIGWHWRYFWRKKT